MFCEGSEGYLQNQDIPYWVKGGCKEDGLGKESTSGVTLQMDKGTTTTAFIVKEGMVVAVDSRATAGSYIASQTVNKVIEVNKYLLGTMAGGAADCYYWERMMGRYAQSYELHYGERITAGAAARHLSTLMYQYKGKGLSLGTMVCGWDTKGPGLYYVDNEANYVSGKLFSVGSGSLFAYGVLNAEYREDLSREEALELGKRAIFHAGHRDAYSGGVVNLYFIDQEGWQKVGSYDISALYHEYMEQ
ncbi:20S proteasome subunit beta 5 [Nematocida homosporus]|uniref:20S proteasome subunit beta 5 n=1 Tax=Nematocida homosporus TaxID=1912981 RepID=UPI00221E9ED1|nr:20S proteasome subunit beta 5 [Nematocida homosporus]KAI5187062.1 20S proteasome subunit beta 5 [Nematocida homosporus]